MVRMKTLRFAQRDKRYSGKIIGYQVKINIAGQQSILNDADN